MPSAARATSWPLPGPQTEFPRTPTDICIYGGAAGGPGSGNDVALAAEGILDAFHGHRVSALTITRITVGTGD